MKLGEIYDEPKYVLANFGQERVKYVINLVKLEGKMRLGVTTKVDEAKFFDSEEEALDYIHDWVNNYHEKWYPLEY